MGIFDFFKKNKGNTGPDGFKQCDKGHYYKETEDDCMWCENTSNESNKFNSVYKQCDKGHFYEKTYESCIYCENIEKVKHSESEEFKPLLQLSTRIDVDDVEVYKNGQIKSEGKSDYFWGGCTGQGGPFDCEGKGCVECLPPIKRKKGLWKYYYDNGQLKKKINYKGGVVISEKCWDENGNQIESK